MDKPRKSTILWCLLARPEIIIDPCAYGCLSARILEEIEKVFTEFVNGGEKVRRAADENRGTRVVLTPSGTGCQSFFNSYSSNPKDPQVIRG